MRRIQRTKGMLMEMKRKEVLRRIPCVVSGADESLVMFSGNNVEDDVAVLANMLSQIKDGIPANEASVYDEPARIDWGVDEILLYIREKYGATFC